MLTLINPAAPSPCKARPKVNISIECAVALTNAAAANDATSAMVREFRRRRDVAHSMLREAGLDVVEPHGAFYLYVRVSGVTPDDTEPGTTLARRLLDECGVAVVPGAAFHTPEWIRVSYAAPAEDVIEGMRRIITMCISYHTHHGHTYHG